MLQEIQRQTSESDQIDNLNRVAWEIRHYDLHRMTELSEQSLQLSQALSAGGSYTRGIAESLRNLGWTTMQRTEYENALTILLEAKRLFVNLDDESGQSSVMNTVGRIHTSLGNFPYALEAHLEALKISRSAADRSNEAEANSRIGVVYTELGDYQQCLSQVTRSLQIYEEIGDRKGEADALNTGCTAYRFLGEFEKSRHYGLKSLEIYREIRAVQGEAEALSSLGELHVATGDYAAALDYFRASVELAAQIGDKYRESIGLMLLGETYRRTGITAESLRCFQNALLKSNDANARHHTHEIHKGLAKVYEQLGDYQKAFLHFQQFHAIKESLFNKQADSRLKILRVLHELESAQQDAEIHQLRNVELKNEISQREQLIDDLNAFAHTVAHDLKTPLHLIIAYSDLVRDDEAKNMSEQGASWLEVIGQAGTKMDVIINELLTLAGVRQQEILPKLLDMPTILESVEQRLAHVITQSGAEIIHPQQWHEAAGYAPWIEEVWANYIGNAIKYGGNPPRIQLGSTLNPNGKVRFWVRDNGNGIAAELQQELFTPFKRLEETRVAGHGLGLSIVRRIIEKLGGEVSVDSQPGEGSTFSFTLPRP